MKKLKTKSKLKREEIFRIHNSNIFELEKLLSINEARKGIANYRKLLISFAEGKVLETGVGTSNNLRFYALNPRKLNILGIDYSPNALELAVSKDIKSVEIDYKLEDVEK